MLVLFPSVAGSWFIADNPARPGQVYWRAPNGDEYRLEGSEQPGEPESGQKRIGSRDVPGMPGCDWADESVTLFPWTESDSRALAQVQFGGPAVPLDPNVARPITITIPVTDAPAAPVVTRTHIAIPIPPSASPAKQNAFVAAIHALFHFFHLG